MMNCFFRQNESATALLTFCLFSILSLAILPIHAEELAPSVCNPAEPTAMFDHSQMRTAYAGTGMHFYFERNDPNVLIDLKITDYNISPLDIFAEPIEYLVEDISEDYYNFVPPHGDGNFYVQLFAKDSCGGNRSRKDSEDIYYNDVENSPMKLWADRNQYQSAYIFPMSDSDLVAIKNTFGYLYPPYYSVVSRTIGVPGTAKLDSSKLINEAIHLETYTRDGTIYWYANVDSNPSDLDVTTAYLVDEERNLVASTLIYNETYYNIATIPYDYLPNGTWYLGEAGAVLQENIVGNTWAITE